MRTTNKLRCERKNERLKVSLTQLDVADQDALLGLFEDLLEVNAGEAAGEAGEQHGQHADYLRTHQQLLPLGAGGRPRWPLRVSEGKAESYKLKPLCPTTPPAPNHFICKGVLKRLTASLLSLRRCTVPVHVSQTSPFALFVC